MSKESLSSRGGRKADAGCSSGGRPLGLPVPNGRFGEAIPNMSFPHVRQKARRDSSRRIPPVLWRTLGGNPEMDPRHIFGEEHQVLPRTLSEMSDKAHPEKCSRKGRAAKCSAHIIVGNTSKLPRLVLAHWRLHWARALRHSEMTFFLGEVIISPKRALLQAPLYQASFQEELARYICHGILHLAGFKDKTKPQKNEMRKKEDEILSLSKSYINRIV